MGEFFPAQVFKQLSHARAVIERHLAATLDTIHLFGSAIDGGLKPDSDIDLLALLQIVGGDKLII
ncbi:TPA: nucleotidyltransferase domain-containing protein, partial [Escherichia coli O103:H2]